jgi:hypothetical protein
MTKQRVSRDPRCPICNGEDRVPHIARLKSFDVCDFHQNWLVTPCYDCGAMIFRYPGTAEARCTKCERKSLQTARDR